MLSALLAEEIGPARSSPAGSFQLSSTSSPADCFHPTDGDAGENLMPTLPAGTVNKSKGKGRSKDRRRSQSARKQKQTTADGKPWPKDTNGQDKRTSMLTATEKKDVYCMFEWRKANSCTQLQKRSRLRCLPRCTQGGKARQRKWHWPACGRHSSCRSKGCCSRSRRRRSSTTSQRTEGER